MAMAATAEKTRFYPEKETAHNSPISVPFDAIPAAIFLTKGVKGSDCAVLFNDDLANAKLTTINVAFSATLQ